MKFKVGDKVRVTRDWCDAKAGMEGEVVLPETDIYEPFIRFPGWTRGHDGGAIGARSPLPEGSKEGHFIPEDRLELIEQEKPVEQVYEVGGTLTLAEAIKAAKSGEIIADAREGSRAVWKEQALRWEATGNPVHIHEYYLTGWRVVPKPVPMTRELQEAIERYLDYAGVPTPTEVGEYSTFYAAYQKAKEAAK